MHKKNNFKKKTKQITALVLVICILAVSMPAAPKTIVERTGELKQDIRFAFLSGNLAIAFPNWMKKFFDLATTPSQSAEVDRIQIFPGSVTVKQGENVIFTAVSYDNYDEIVSAVKIDWEVADNGRKTDPRPLPNGKFEARVIGEFTVTASGGGQRAEVTVTVEPSVGGSPSQANLQNVTPISISTKDTKKNKDDKEEDSGVQANSQNSTSGAGGWNNGNWQSSDDPGNQPGNPLSQPADDGAGNNNFQITAPILSLPGRKTDLELNLVYNSRLWNKSGNELTFDIDRGFPAPGWSIGFGKLMDMGSNGGSMLVDSDGTRHGYSGLIFPGYGGGSSFKGYTTDGKFIDYESFRDNAGIFAARASFSDGTLVFYSAKNEGAVYPTFIRDAQGNVTTVTYRNNEGPAIQTITNTTGQIINFEYDSLGRLISIKAPRMQDEDPIYGNGKNRTLVKIHYKPLTLNYSFEAGITPAVRNGTVWVIDAIYYPGTQTGFWFGDTDSYSSYGMITKVLEQRGMNWTASSEDQGVISAGLTKKRSDYNYPLTTTNESGRTNGINLNDAPTHTKLAESWAERDVNEDRITTYSINNNDSHFDGTSNSPCRTIAITQSNGTISKQYSYRLPGSWKDGLIFADETIVTNGSIPVIVSSSIVSWQEGDYNSPRPAWAEITDENGKKIKTVYDYGSNPFNQIVRSCDYDNNGAKLRCTNAEYENSQAYKGTWNPINTGNGYQWYFAEGRHILNLVKSATTENPDGSIASRTEYEYDNYSNQPLIDTPEVIQHDSTHNPYTTETRPVQGACIQWEEHPYGGQYCVAWEEYEVSVYDPATEKRGNLTKKTTYADAANVDGANYETQGFDITGNTRINSTACCEQTTTEFSIATQYAFPESQTRGSADVNSPHRISVSSVYDRKSGLLKQQTDANGRTTTLMYNPESLRPVKSILSTGAYTNFTYDDVAMTVTEDVRDSSGNQAGKTIQHLNGLGLTRRKESLAGIDIWDIVDMKFTKLGEEWKQSRPYRSGEVPQFSEKFYDQQRRLIKIIEPDGSETRAFYNETQRPDSASNLAGTTTRVVDAWGRERWGRYDQRGRLAELVEPNPNGNGSVFAPQSLATKYTYNTLNKLVKVEQGLQIREFKYDSLGRLTRQKLAEQTASLNDDGQYVGAGSPNARWGEAFWYDSRSNLIMKNDARGVKTHFSYQINGAEDPLNRLGSVGYDLSGPRDTSKIVHNAASVHYSYVNTGDKTRPSQIRTDGILTEDFSYDSEGRLRDFTQKIDGRTDFPMTVSYLYDSLDRVTDTRYPAQYGLPGNPRKLIQNTYDVASRLSGLMSNYQQIAGNIVYNSADQTTSVKVGPAGANQITESYQYDQQTGLLTNQKVQKNTQVLMDLTYDYNRNNAVGNLNGKTGHLTRIINNLDNNKNRKYEYDALGRLTKAQGGNNLWEQTYSYDRYGNRTDVAATGVAADNSAIPMDGIPDLTYVESSNRINTPGFEYDNAGNQTRALDVNGKWLRYEYDAANRIQTVTSDTGTYFQSFQYGSSNARVMDFDYKYGSLKIFASTGGVTLAEYTEFVHTIQTWTKSYVYLEERLLSTVTPNGNDGESIEYDHPDRLGTRIITNSGASSEQTTLPFGTALNGESTTSISKRFTSYERSARTGLDYAINRTYDPKLGRFTQIDPIGMNSVDYMNPQTLNLYSYCGNDPINHLDPDGLSWLGNFFRRIFNILIAVITVVNKIIRVAATVVAIALIFVSPMTALLFFAKSVIEQLIGMVAETILRNIKQSIRENGWSLRSIFRGLWRGIKQAFDFLKAIVTRSLKDWIIPIYGYWCAPGWGIDGPTVNQEPIDELDAACKKHDEDMRRISEMSAKGLITKKEAKRLKTKYDLQFMRRAFSARARHGNAVFGAFLQIAFLLRIVLRYA